MAKKHSSVATEPSAAKAPTDHAATQKPARSAFLAARERQWAKKRGRVSTHRSFHRSYREDTVRPLELPGFLHHAVDSFITIFKNWRVFLPLIALTVIVTIFAIGLMSEDLYAEFQTAIDNTATNFANGKLGSFAKAGLLLISTIATGGLNQTMGEVEELLVVIVFLMLWLVTTYLLRRIVAGKKPLRLRDALYNACAPLISTACIAVVFFIQLIPIFIVTIVYSAAELTDFLATPFYALVFFIFASLMILLSLYLVSATAVALIAVSAPGLYPLQALHVGSDLLLGRRFKFAFRLVFLVFVVAVIYVVTMIPLMMLDMWLKARFDALSGVPFTSLCLATVTIFAFIYVTTYLYLLYRYMIAYDAHRPAALADAAETASRDAASRQPENGHKPAGEER